MNKRVGKDIYVYILNRHMDGAIENFISFCKAEEEKFAECYHRKKS